MLQVVIIALAVLPLSELVTGLIARWAGRWSSVTTPLVFIGSGVGLAWMAQEDPIIGLAGSGLATLLRALGLAVLALRDIAVQPRRR